MNLNDTPTLDAATRSKIAKDALTDHKAKMARKHSAVDEEAKKIAQARAIVDAANEASAPLHALEQERRHRRAQAFAGLTTFDSTEIDKKILAAQRERDKHASSAEAASDAIAIVLEPAHAQAQRDYAAEAQRGAGLRYDLLRAQVDVELDRRRQTFSADVVQHARVAAACLAADRFADAQAGRPHVGPPPYSISLRPHIPDCCIPVVPDSARAAAMASWEFPVAPATAEALTEILKLVE